WVTRWEGDGSERAGGRQFGGGSISTDVADANGQGQHVSAFYAEMESTPQPLANACDIGRDGRSKNTGRETRPGAGIEGSDWWSVHPAVGRVAHGIPARVGKLRALGNAIVPQVAAEFIMSFDEISRQQ